MTESVIKEIIEKCQVNNKNIKSEKILEYSLWTLKFI